MIVVPILPLIPPSKFEGFCVMCLRDNRKRSFPRKRVAGKKPAFFKGVCPGCARDFEPLNKMKVENAPERLIETIQSVTVPREDREAALVELMRRFQYLIKKQVTDVYLRYKLKERIRYEYQEFFHDGLAEFINLVCNDFQIKDDPNTPGMAYFGNYIMVKFYRRLQHIVKKKLRSEVEDATDFEAVLNSNQSQGDNSQSFGELKEAIVANSFEIEDQVLENMTQEQCHKLLEEIFAISHDLIRQGKIDQRDRDIWEAYYDSGLMIEEIGKHFESREASGGTIGRSRVLKIARQVNEKIVAEWGRRNALRLSGISHER